MKKNNLFQPNIPNILLIGTECQDSMSGLVDELTLTDELPPVGHFRFDPSDISFVEVGTDPLSGLVRRIVETPVANYFETAALATYGGNAGGRPCCGTMGEYVKEVESDLRSHGLLPDHGKIDIVWYCLGDRTSIHDEFEQDFIRSAAAIPDAGVKFGGALVVADPGFSSRSAFKETMDFLEGLAGNRVVLNCVVVQPDALVLSGPLQLAERTKKVYLGRLEATAAERDAYEAAWYEYYDNVLDDWLEYREEDVSHVLHCAAERAQSILKRNENAKLGDAIGECVSLAANFFKAVKGDAEADVMKKKSKAEAEWCHQRVNELKFNIVCQIYEVAACHGRVVPLDVVRYLLRLVPDDFPSNDAVAVTYAVGRVASVLAGDSFWYVREEDVKTMFEDAKKEALRMDFEPFDDSSIVRGKDGEIEPDIDSGETGGGIAAHDGCGDRDGQGSGSGADLRDAPETDAPTEDEFFKEVTERIRQSWADKEESKPKSRAAVLPVMLGKPAAGVPSAVSHDTARDSAAGTGAAAIGTECKQESRETISRSKKTAKSKSNTRSAAGKTAGNNNNSK